MCALIAHSGTGGLPLWAAAALLFWLALRRWKMYSVNDASKKLDELNDRYE